MRKIHTDKAPKALGSYSQAVIHQGLIYVSGQIPINPLNGQIESQDIVAQTRQCLENIKSILEEAGSKLKHVLRCGVFMVDLNDFSAMNDIYETYFTDPFPSRAAIQVSRLPKDVKIEIDCIAYLPE